MWSSDNLKKWTGIGLLGQIYFNTGMIQNQQCRVKQANKQKPKPKILYPFPC